MNDTDVCVGCVGAGFGGCYGFHDASSERFKKCKAEKEKWYKKPEEKENGANESEGEK